MGLFKDAELGPGMRVSKRRWDQERLNLVGEQAEAIAAGETEEVEGEGGWTVEVMLDNNVATKYH